MLINTLEIVIPLNSVSKNPPYSNNYLYFCPIPTLDLNALNAYLNRMKSEGVKFTNLIISCTQEIANLPLTQIVNCLNTIRPFFHLFQYKYVRTNGDLLKLTNNSKFVQFYLDFIIRIQRFSVDDTIDDSFFGRPNTGLYIHDYANFPYSKICWEALCLNNASYQSVSEMIDELIIKYNNSTEEIYINTAKIYGTNVNAVNVKELDFTNWILKFAYRRYNTPISEGGTSKNLDEDILDYINILSKNKGLEFEEYWEWNYKTKRIIMNKPTNLQLRYNKNHIFYGDKLIDYSGKEIV